MDNMCCKGNCSRVASDIPLVFQEDDLQYIDSLRTRHEALPICCSHLTSPIEV